MITSQKPGAPWQLVLFLACAIPLSGPADAATFTVTNNANSGDGSLRQAILNANASPGLDSIDFNILDACPRSIIFLETGLPSITSPVDINGYTQPGAAVATSGSPATLCVEINGENIPAFGANGLSLGGVSSGSSIRGLVINRFARSGITIGATSSGNNLRGNYIGTDVTGKVDLGNKLHGIVLQSFNNTVERNLVSGNDNIGCLSIAGGNTSIKDNIFGMDATGTLPLGNGVGVGLGTNNNRVTGNVIAYSTVAGVAVVPTVIPSPLGTPPIIIPSVSNAILSNSIFGTTPGLGIDLIHDVTGCPFCTAFGVPQINDPTDADSGFANNLQNSPVIDGKRSFINPALVEIWGSLDSNASQGYLIQVFSSELADPSGYGEGRALVGEMTVSTDAAGHVDFHVPAMLAVPVGSIITATATDLLTMDTSEFGKWENVDVKGSPTAYENAAGAAGGDGLGYGLEWWAEPVD